MPRNEWDDLLAGVRRRRADAMAKHNAEMVACDVIEALIIEAAALRDPLPESEPVVAEITWTEIWQNHPAAQDFFKQFPDGFPEDRMQS
jgi:flavodoxin